MTTFNRTFGQYQVEVKKDKISIAGNDGSNFGSFYVQNIERYQNHQKTDNRPEPQMISMEWEYGLTQSIKKWLYGLVEKGKLDYLYEEYCLENDIFYEKKVK